MRGLLAILELLIVAILGGRCVVVATSSPVLVGVAALTSAPAFARPSRSTRRPRAP